MEVPNGKPFGENGFMIFADCAVNQYPNAEELAEKKKLLLHVAKVNVKEETENSISFSFKPKSQNLICSKNGSYPYLQRNFALLSALVLGETLAFDERMAIRDQWSSMLKYFGVNLNYEVQMPEFKDEFERRLAKAQGIKMIKTWKTYLDETHTLSPREYFVPGDATLASAYALAALLSSAPERKQDVFSKKSEIFLSFISNGALRRLARCDIPPAREMQGKKFGSSS